MIGRRRRARALVFLLAAEALGTTVEATSYGYRPLDLRAGHGRVAFRQPDGTGTVLDLATGTVLERGGEPPPRWPTVEGCPAERVCALSLGVFRIRQTPSGDVRDALPKLAGRTERGSWELELFFPPSYLWAVEDKLLVQTNRFRGLSTLECLEGHSGRSLWIYVYPDSHGRPGVWPTYLSRERAQNARSRLAEITKIDDVANHDGHDRRDPDPPAPAGPRLVLDPDPLRTRAVRVALVVGWTGLAATLLALFAWPTHRGPIALACVWGLAALVLAVGRVDGALGAALWVGLLATAIVARRSGGGTRSGTLVVLVVIAALLYIIPVLWKYVVR